MPQYIRKVGIFSVKAVTSRSALMRGLAGILLLVIMLGTGLAVAAPFPEDKLPPVLKPWCDWVLDQDNSRDCPSVWNQPDKRECVWPSRLELQAHSDGAEFILTGQLNRRGWIILPGSAHHWPLQVRNAGEDATVLRHNQLPALLIKPGAFRIEGTLAWKQIPDSIPVTPDVGMIDLKINGETISAPEYSQDQIKLSQTRQIAPQAGDNIAFQVYRRLEDRIPQILTTIVKVQVSGNEREITTAEALPAGFTAMEVQSKIPARLDDDGCLRILAQAGTHQITIRARNTSAIDATQVFSRPSSSGPWSAEEIWSIQREGALRSISISGAPSLDPAQTDIPDSWKHLPTYLMHSETALKLTEEERGLQKSGAEHIRVNRQMWLDFDAQGYSVRDTISGRMSNATRLNSGPELELGRARLNGEEQFITRMGENGADGVEVRQQQLKLEADSRIDTPDITSIPALGWDFIPTALHTELNIPPGWRVIAAFGADSTSNTWVQQWSLLDLFVVLLLSIGFARMWGWKCGALALLGLVLTYQEPDAPRFIWLHLLGAAAVLRVAPRGRLQRLVRVYLGGAALAMVVMLLIFSAQQIRSAIYPQLERVSAYHSRYPQPRAESVRSDALMQQPRVQKSMLSAAAVPKQMDESHPPITHSKYSASLETQTGPGIPKWTWRSITFAFNTPVSAGQQMRFIFSPPWITRAGLVAGVLLLLYMFGRIAFALKSSSGDDRDSAPTTPAETHAESRATSLLGVWLLAGALALTCFPAPLHADEPRTQTTLELGTEVLHSNTIPSPDMLDELRRRLTRAPECAPECAALQHLHVDISPETLKIRQHIHSATRSAVPLAFPLGQLSPTHAGTAAGNPPILLRTSQDNSHAQLWASVEGGTTNLDLRAPIPADTTRLDISLPMRAGRITLEAQGWESLNQIDDPANTTTISLQRISETQAPEPEVPQQPLYVEVRRHLDIGVEWYIETSVRRMSSKGKAGVIATPMLVGEQILSPGIQTRDGYAHIELGAEQDAIRFKSRLDKQSPIELKAGNDPHFHEVWQLNLSQLWHADFSGTPLIYNYQNGHWLAQWHPRAHESLLLNVERPHGSPGQHITVESCKLKHTRGEQRSETTLHLDIRSSVATRHTIMLPDSDIEITQVQHNGSDIRIEQDETQLTLPLQAGIQQLDIRWQRQHSPGVWSATPKLKLNAPGVNIDLNLTLPQTRWVLFVGGPPMGPAVLFWGVVLVLGIAAVLLGCYAPTPLRWWHWFILGAGLSQAPLPALLLVAFWLILLGVRRKHGHRIKHVMAFNAMQIGLAIFSACALLALIAAVQQGLLGMPEMQVVGQHSNAWNLNWYQDRSNTTLPVAWAISVPLLVYRGLMLLWALWLALALLKWLRWGWTCWSAGELWRPLPRRVRTPDKKKAEAPPDRAQNRNRKER